MRETLVEKSGNDVLTRGGRQTAPPLDTRGGGGGGGADVTWRGADKKRERERLSGSLSDSLLHYPDCVNLQSAHTFLAFMHKETHHDSLRDPLRAWNIQLPR